MSATFGDPINPYAEESAQPMSYQQQLAQFGVGPEAGGQPGRRRPTLPGEETPPPPDPIGNDLPSEPSGGQQGGDQSAALSALMGQVAELRNQLAESRRVDPFEVARQERRANQASMRAAISWLPSQLIDTYIDEWVKTGDSELSWAVVRQSGQYDQYFPQNRRPDGTLRMSEQDYMSHKDAFSRELRQFGLNPKVFEQRHQDLVAGDVSVQEFRQRISAKVTGVLQNLPEVRSRFGEFYGVGEMSDEALIAASLDPEIGTELLQGRMTAAQISGEALRAGFERGVERSEMLGQAGGLTQMEARELYSDAGEAVPMFGRFAQRFGGGPFGIEEYEEAAVFGDSELQRRMRRLHASEMALFRQGGTVAVGQQGEFAGLRRR